MAPRDRVFRLTSGGSKPSPTTGEAGLLPFHKAAAVRVRLEAEARPAQEKVVTQTIRETLGL